MRGAGNSYSRLVPGVLRGAQRLGYVIVKANEELGPETVLRDRAAHGFHY